MNKHYKVIAKSFIDGSLSEVNMPSQNLNVKRLSLEEIKEIVKEEFGKAKKVEDEEAEEVNWADADLENQIDWVKKLDLKESLGIKSSK